MLNLSDQQGSFNPLSSPWLACTGGKNRAPSISRAGWNRRAIAHNAIDKLCAGPDPHIIPYCGANESCGSVDFRALTVRQSISFRRGKAN